MSRYGFRSSSAVFSIVAALLAALALASGTAAASTTAEGHKVPRIVEIYCKNDYKRLCPGYKVRTRSATLCMKSYAKELSPVCKKAMIDSGLAERYGY